MGFLIIPIGIGLVVLIHLYLWQRLVRDTAVTRRWRRLGGFALLLAAVAMIGSLLSEPLAPWADWWLVGPGYLWVGLTFYLLIVLLVLELPVLLALWASRWSARRAARQPAPAPAPTEAPAPAPAPTPAPTKEAPAEVPAGPAPGLGRRQFLRRGAAVTAAAAAAGLGGYGMVRAYAPPTIKRVQIPLARLDPRAAGLRIAVVSDLHVGPLYGQRFVRRVVEMVNELDADLVTVVGDMVSSEAGAVAESAAPLRELRSRYGSYFVTGNHEYYTGHEEWIEAADELNLRVLRNERLEIVHRGGAIDLAGVNDREGEQFDDPPDYRAALADRDESRPVVLLAHQPVQVHRAAEYGVDLQLSGHTHGGQLVPFNLLVRLDQPVVSDLSEVDGTLVYVTNGAGFWGPPMRVGADPDITLVELHPR
ncbi:metallophosphoesterase [Natronosporangium hydrolyticum]|uniref:metallophosphoesterase n=1 Tax=Natronosporangium hydrolyticum TaxID=2811111 RepID=UPI001EFA1B82|nr:metallophosphoesterase [Natronosporangium hydrolyticum]